MIKEEMLTYYDEKLNELGTASRSEIHAKGLLHKVVHLWIIEKTPDGNFIYFQQRAFSKKDFPGLYDISSAGHMDIGENEMSAVRRETREEIGISIISGNLKNIGTFREKLRMDNFKNNELCTVFAYFLENPVFKIGPEVEKMVKIPFLKFKKFTFEKDKSITAYSIDNNDMLFLKGKDFCFHDWDYVKWILSSIEKLF